MFSFKSRIGVSANPNRTDKQKAVTQRFCMAHRVLAPIRALLNTYMVSRGKQKGYNLAVSHFIKYCLNGDYPDQRVLFSQIQLSKGPLSGSTGRDLCLTEEGLRVSWVGNQDRRSTTAKHNVMCMVFSETSMVLIALHQSALRCDGVLMLSLPPGLAGDVVHVFLFFFSPTEQKASNSEYVGCVGV